MLHHELLTQLGGLLIQAAQVARAKEIEAKQADKTSAGASKPSGKRARAQGTTASRLAAKVA